MKKKNLTKLKIFKNKIKINKNIYFTFIKINQIFKNLTIFKIIKSKKNIFSKTQFNKKIKINKIIKIYNK